MHLQIYELIPVLLAFQSINEAAQSFSSLNVFARNFARYKSHRHDCPILGLLACEIREKMTAKNRIKEREKKDNGMQ